MLKVLVSLDCDECGHPLPQALVCSVPDPLEWQAAGDELIAKAQQAGWDFHHNRSLCSECNCCPAVQS